MKLGYARVSTDDQSLDVQIEQLRRAGCGVIIREKGSGKSAALRSQLQRCIVMLETGKDPEYDPKYSYTMGFDSQEKPTVLVVTKLDRLARNTRDLLAIIDRVNQSGAGFCSLGEPWADTTTPAGRMVMTVFAGIAEFERARILERTAEGRALAKRNGVRMGRPSALSNEQKRAALKMLEEEPVRKVARIFQVSERTMRTIKAGNLA